MFFLMPFLYFTEGIRTLKLVQIYFRVAQRRLAFLDLAIFVKIDPVRLLPPYLAYFLQLRETPDMRSTSADNGYSFLSRKE